MSTELEEHLQDLPFVRSSERADYKKCPTRWWWRYVENLVPANSLVGAREFGTGIHLCLAEWYGPLGLVRGTPLLETWKTWTDEARKEAEQHRDYSKEDFDAMVAMGEELLEEYLYVHGRDPHWDVIAVEITFEVNVDGRARAIGTIDLVVRDLNDGFIKIIDHKTCKSFPNVAWLNLDDQAGSYSAFAQHILRQKGLIKPREIVKGMEYNWIRKGKVDHRPVNADGMACNKPKKEHYQKALHEKYTMTGKETLAQLEELAAGFHVEVFGEPSANQPAPLFKRDFIGRTSKEKRKQLERLIDDTAVMQLARTGQIPILKTPNTLCTFCDFFDLCQIDESQGDVEMFKKRMFRELDPYHDHRPDAVNSKLTVADHRREVHNG